MKFHAKLILAATLLLTACDKPEPVDIAPQRQAMEKARGVERTLQQGADESRAKIDQAEQGQ